MSTQIYYRLITEKSEFIVNALSGAWPDLTVGQQATVRFFIRDDGNLTVSSGDSHTVSSDTAEFYETITVDGTLTVEDDAELVVGASSERFNNVADYGEYAGHASTGLGLDTTPFFTDQLKSDAPITSLVMGVEPGPKPTSLGREGFWGLLTGFRDETNSTTTRHAVSLELWVLAVPFSEYSSVEAVKQDLEA